MSDEENAIVSSDPTANLPAHLRDAPTDLGVDLRAEDVMFPRLQIMQSTSDPVKDGEAVVGQVRENVGNDLVLDRDEEMEFIPIFHFLSWIEWGDIDEGGGIVEMSTDPKSELAMRAAKRETNAKGDIVVTENHNFIVLLRHRPDELYMLTCAKTSHKHGRKLLNLIRRRERILYSGAYTASTKKAHRDKLSWYEWEFANAGTDESPESAWATEAEFKACAQKYEELKLAHAEQRLRYETEREEGEAPSDDPGF